MKVQKSIESSLGALQPDYLDVVNESHMHNVPANSETHFKITVVSSRFDGKMLVARHRLVNELLREHLDGPVHALALHTRTPGEWFEQGGATTDSPQCMGGSAAESAS